MVVLDGGHSGYSNKIQAIYRTYFDVSSGTIKMDSANSSGYYSASGSNAVGVFAAMSTNDWRIGSVWAELRNVVNKGNVASCYVVSNYSGTLHANYSWASSGSNKELLQKAKNFKILEKTSTGETAEEVTYQR